EEGLQRYVTFMKRQGVYAEYWQALGTGLVDELERLAHEVVRRFPRAVFFAGQLIFQQPTFWDKVLHNQTAFTLQRRLQFGGLRKTALPIPWGGCKCGCCGSGWGPVPPERRQPCWNSRSARMIPHTRCAGSWRHSGRTRTPARRGRSLCTGWRWSASWSGSGPAGPACWQRTLRPSLSSSGGSSSSSCWSRAGVNGDGTGGCGTPWPNTLTQNCTE